MRNISVGKYTRIRKEGTLASESIHESEKTLPEGFSRKAESSI